MMRILYVEDDSMNRRVVRDMFASLGMNIDEAPDVATGLRMVEEEHFDAIVTDLMMPGADGLALIRAIRRRADAGAAVPILVLTADTSDLARDKCISGGANGVMTKPVGITTLVERLGTVIAASTGMIFA
ncbi:response regulator [Sphingomonas sp. BIUV-7]|uniref:Response regulator n=1 Tax=Sphingomonas natans TaxID=3063330 RepID=A0ABT8Y992_9SPHN|nr:response regulator [Sphingomonas sp. BIUV-7]MDO6414894.1 response regulator [Sphingomonas sp. BIUV-7]